MRSGCPIQGERLLNKDAEMCHSGLAENNPAGAEPTSGLLSSTALSVSDW